MVTWRSEGQVLAVHVVWATGLIACSGHTEASRVQGPTKPLLFLLHTVLTCPVLKASRGPEVPAQPGASLASLGREETRAGLLARLCWRWEAVAGSG